MRRSIPQTLTATELAKLSPASREAIHQLQEAKRHFDLLTTYDDPGEGVRVVTLFAVHVLRGCAADSSLHTPEATNNFHFLADIIDNFGGAIAYRQRVDAGQINIK